MTSAAHFGGDPVGPDSDIAWIVEVWNLMGGQIDWNALEPLCEMLGIDDPDALVRGLVQLRNHFRDVNGGPVRA